MDVKHLHKKDLDNLLEYREKYLALMRFIKNEYIYYDVAFTKHKDIDDFKIAQVLYKIVNNEKK